MQRDDTTAEIKVMHALEPGRFHHALERLLVRMLADGLGQVAVTRLVVRYRFSEPRQHAEGQRSQHA